MHSVITVLDPGTGEPRAIINGDSVTGLRTSTATTLAMQHTTPAADIAGSHGATVKRDLEPAVRDADIVVLCTSSLSPVIEDDWVTDGTTVASVGSFAPTASSCRHRFLDVPPSSSTTARPP